MWYALILYFLCILIYNLYVKDTEDEIEVFLDMTLPMAGIGICALLGIGGIMI